VSGQPGAGEIILLLRHSQAVILIVDFFGWNPAVTAGSGSVNIHLDAAKLSPSLTT
jgi:hypothetical protein